MKVSEFVKYVVVPVLLVMFLAALFRPLCMENGECDYLKLWFFMGIPFGIHRMSVWVIPKNYDIGGSMGVLVINVLVGGAIGGVALVWKLIVAAAYLVKAAGSGMMWMIRKVTGRPCKVS
ncbi:hypothetical protein FMM74_019100 [Lachnospiraceae bacterium MD308]|nr:hypothetical protein [Lachnospiraceae bacterium MD308]